MAGLIRRIIEIVRTGEIEYGELQGSLMALVWGICLMFVQAPSLDLPPPVLGTALLAVAGVQLGGIRELSYGARRIGAMMAIVVWTFVSGEAADGANAWRFVICPTCLSFSIAAAWGYYRIGRRHEAKIQLRTRQVH